MQETDFERKTGRPTGLMLIVGALALIGAFTVLGWLFGTLMFFFKLAVLVLVIFAIVTAVRALARR